MSETLVLPKIALAGPPNCGKTALFNALTGGKQKVANYPGVTVERKEGLIIAPNGQKFKVLDLPGSYSLDARTPDEQITRDILLGHYENENPPQTIIAVADATNLERNLGFVLELKSLGAPVILALNMMDLAEQRGLHLNLELLEKELEIPVIPTVATKNKGLDSLLESLSAVFSQSQSYLRSEPQQKKFETVQERFKRIDELLQQATIKQAHPTHITEKLDKIFTHPVFGPLILVGLLSIIFEAVFSWATPLADGIEGLLSWVSLKIGNIFSDGALKSLLVDGIITGVGSVLVFLPQILILYAFILLLEDSGYMARAAFLMDKIMGKAGLHGKAFIPLLSSFACAIPGIMATRTIENKRDRFLTILIAPLMTCSARLPVYTLLIAAFIPNIQIFGFFHLQGLVMLSLYLLGILIALAVAFTLKKLVFKGDTAPLILELPTYKIPTLKNLWIGLTERARLFLRRAGTIILSISILLWFLSSYPKPPENPVEPAIRYSYAGKIGNFISPLIEPIGFNWQIGIALIPGFAAREVMVSALSTVYAIEESESEGEQKLQEKLVGLWSIATALSVLAWYVVAPQCLSTLAVTRRETNSWKWTLIMLFYLTILAYVFSWITFQTARFFGLG